MLFRSKPRILVVGTAHLDTHISRDMDSPDLFARGSRLVHAIGGSAYNIAVNLGLSATFTRKEVVLYTILPKEAELTDTIVETARKANVSTEWIRRLTLFNGKPLEIGGFVALCHTDNSIRKAAADPNFNEIDVFGDHVEGLLLKRLVRTAKLVVADTNLQSPNIAEIARICQASAIPLFISLVSETTAAALGRSPASASTLISGRKEEVTCLVAMALGSGRLGADEARALQALQESLKSADALAPEVIARALGGLDTKNLVCVYPHHYRLFSANEGTGTFLDLAQPTVVGSQGNAIGQREAVVAAFVDVCLNHCAKDRMLAKIDLRSELMGAIDTYVRPVLNSVGATPGAVISFKETATPTFLSRVWTGIVRFGERARAVVAIFSITGWLVAMGLTIAVLLGWITLEQVRENVCQWRYLPLLCAR